MEPVTTFEILARRALARECGKECVSWAIEMLTAGHDSHSLRVLSGLVAPYNHFEVAALRDAALAEISPVELRHPDPVVGYVAERVEGSLERGEPLSPLFEEVSRLYAEQITPPELQPFYLLHFANQDLKIAETQWYWPGATRENIHKIMEEEARKFVKTNRA